MQAPNESLGFPGPSNATDPNFFLAPSLHEPRSTVELQKLLIDERLRSETHRTNYQTLKEEHKKLQDEFTKVQNGFARLHDGKTDSAEHMQELVNDLQAQIASKSRELEEVRSQTLHPHKLEVLKSEIAKELEEPLKAHLLAMDKDVEKYRTEYNKIRYEFTFLKSEYDHAKAEYARNIEELRLRYQAQLSALQQERDDLLNKQKTSVDVDAQKLLKLSRQKTQLEQRIKNLLEEINELQKQKEKVVLEADSVQRSLAKEASQLRANIQSLESDKRSCDFQCERLQKELRDSNEQNMRMNQQIQNLNRECSSLKSLADEESHRHKVALTNQKLEALKLKGDLERERESLINKTQNMQAEIDILQASADNHMQTIEDLEREATRRVDVAREEEWNKNNTLQNEKICLEEKCRELELRLEAEKSSRINEREESEEKLRHFEMGEVTSASEISQLKKQVEMEARARLKMEQEAKDVASLRQRLLERDHELQTMTSLRQQAIGEAERLKEMVRDVRADTEAARNQANRVQVEAEKSIDAYKLEVMEEKHRQQSRLDQMEHKFKQNNEHYEKVLKQQKKIKLLLVSKVKQMKKKIELLEADREKLQIELKAGRHGVSMEEHNKVRHRLREFKRRHNEFRHVIGLGEHVTPIPFDTNLQQATMVDALGLSRLANITNTSNQDSLNRKEVSLVLKRLDDIAESQKVQMEALEAVAKPTRDDKSQQMKLNLPPQRPNHLSLSSENSSSSQHYTSSAHSDKTSSNKAEVSQADYADDFNSNSD